MYCSAAGNAIGTIPALRSACPFAPPLCWHDGFRFVLKFQARTHEML